MPGEVTKSGPGKETGERGDVTVQIQENGRKKSIINKKIKIKITPLRSEKHHVA